VKGTYQGARFGLCRVAAALIAAVAERVRADVPESVVRQLAENEYQAHLHKIQLKVRPPASLRAPLHAHARRGCLRAAGRARANAWWSTLLVHKL
jgi:hypothetical protein